MRVCYTAFVSGQFSQTSAKKQLGLEDMKHCTAEIKRYTKVKEAIDEMAMLEIHSLAINHGLSCSEDECDSSSDVEDRRKFYFDENEAIFIELIQESKDSTNAKWQHSNRLRI